MKEMNRKYIFRGKSVAATNVDRWTFGLFGSESTQLMGLTFPARGKVDTTTIGQWTGLNASSKDPIFEDDVVEFEHNGRKTVGKVIFSDGCYWAEDSNGIYYLLYQFTSCKILGNIHDNPELWEVAK